MGFIKVGDDVKITSIIEGSDAEPKVCGQCGAQISMLVFDEYDEVETACTCTNPEFMELDQ